MYKRRGYTLIEVLMVVMVVSVVAAIIVPQMLQAGTLGVQAAARMIIADIMYAQNDAVAHLGNRQVEFDVENNSYKLTDGEGNTLAAPWRGGTATYVVDLNRDNRFAGVRITEAAFDDGNTLRFDEMGGALVGGHVLIEYNDDRYRIIVSPFTGRVEIKKED